MRNEKNVSSSTTFCTRFLSRCFQRMKEAVLCVKLIFSSVKNFLFLTIKLQIFHRKYILGILNENLWFLVWKRYEWNLSILSLDFLNVIEVSWAENDETWVKGKWCCSRWVCTCEENIYSIRFQTDVLVMQWNLILYLMGNCIRLKERLWDDV